MKKLNVSDVVFLAMMAAIFLLACTPFVPFMMNITKLGAQAALTALFYGVFGSIGLYKTKKPGSLVLFGLMTGLFLLFMQPVMFANQVVGAIVAEALSILIFRTYANPKAIATAAGTYALFTIPTTAVMNYFAKGRMVVEQIGDPISFAAIVILTLVLGLLGVKIGEKIVGELRKAGKIE